MSKMPIGINTGHEFDRRRIVKCPKCGIEVKDKHFTFEGIPKKYFCSSCWYKIYTVWKAQKYIFEDPDAWYWTSKINKVIDE